MVKYGMGGGEGWVLHSLAQSLSIDSNLPVAVECSMVPYEVPQAHSPGGPSEEAGPKAQLDRYGIIRPLPMIRSKVGTARSIVAKGRKSTASESGEFNRIKFNVGSSSLANRFPHLVQTRTLT